MNSNPESHEDLTSPEAQRPDAPRIYVASLSDYNNGRLHGAWIDANQSIDEIWEEVGEMLANSQYDPAEEHAIHDFSGFGPFQLSEDENLEDVSRLGRGIAEHGAAFAAFAASLDHSERHLLDDFLDHYRGQWASMAEYAEELLKDIGVDLDAIAPEMLQPYISVDLDAFGRDLTYDYLVCDDGEGGVYVFDTS